MPTLRPAEPAASLLSDHALIAEKTAEIAASADLYPGVVVVHNVPRNAVEYMSARGLELLGTTLAELREMGPAYHDRFFNPQEVHDYAPQVVSLLSSHDPTYTVSFFQQVRTGPARQYAWYLSNSRLLLRNAQGLPLLILTVACPIDPQSHITLKVQRLLDENNFLRGHQARFARLTRREREVLRLQVLGHSSQETAGQLFISVHTAETHRRNIRRKLATQSVFELSEYARAFNLV